MLRNFKFDYDQKNDSLFLYDPNSKSKASIEIDDLIIDYNSKKEVSGIEMLKASAFFKSMDSKGFDKEVLNDIKECKLDIISKSNFLFIKVIMFFKSNKVLETPMFIPQITEASPALAIS